MMNIALCTAIAIWRSGQPIDLCLAAKLIELGFDVEALEMKYLRA